jgi:hypothetical protein
MADDVTPVVRGIQKRFRDLSVDVREERVIRYLVKQLCLGRHVDEIMEDPYLRTHTSEAGRAQILQNPAVIKAIEREIERQFATYREATWCAESDREPDLEPKATAMINCPKGGLENTTDSNFCRRCGARMVVEPSETTLAYSLVEGEDIFTRLAAHASAVSGTVLLIRAGGDREGEIVYLDKDVLTIGRSPQSDLFLDDVTVSRHHARISLDADGFMIEDLNSLNGSYVNRKRIERHQLVDGDELQIGKFKLAFLEQNEDV